jgi:ribosomal-protein-alanine N-acetyltransferase
VKELARGGRIHLSAPSARDRDEFLEAVARSRRLHRRWVTPPADAEAFAQYLRRLRRDDAVGLLVRRNDDGSLVGALTLSQIFLGPFRSAYLGYYAFDPHQGRGLMSEALDLTLRHAFGTLGLHRVEANIQPDNTASIALVRRAGLRLEGFSPRYLKVAGRWRDHERWAITAEDRRRA